MWPRETELWAGGEQKTGEGQGWEEDIPSGGERRIFLQGTRVRNDPQGDNQVEISRTEDTHTAARGELHIYF